MRRAICAILVVALAWSLAARGRAADPTSKPTATSSAPACRVSVDPRVELMSIIFRLAGNSEYRKGRVASYTKDVDEHFRPFADHAVVKLARKLRQKRGVSYDAVMSMAVHVTDAFTLKEAVPFKPHPKNLDRRWHTKEAREFLAEARKFVKDTKFKKFIADHQKLYDGAAKAMDQTMAKHAHLDWFDKFFGQPPGAKFEVILGMLNGGNCYGAKLKTDERERLYCMLGVWKTDRRGAPAFGKPVVPTVVHEFNHSYVNPLVYARADDFAASGKKIFPRVRKAMRRQAYGTWLTVVHESVVRASVVRYRAANEGDFAAFREIVAQHKRGFKWVQALSALLAEYEQQRDKYPTLDDFMPKIVEFFNKYAASLPEPKPATRPTAPRDT